MKICVICCLLPVVLASAVGGAAPSPDDERSLYEAQRMRLEEEDAHAAARRARERAAREAEAARLKRIEEAKAWRRDYRAVTGLFAAPFCLVEGHAVVSRLQNIREHTTLWAVFSSFSKDHLVYEVKAAPGGMLAARALSAEAAPQPVDVALFLARIRGEPFAATSGGKVWVGGVTSPVGSHPVPPRGEDFWLDEICLTEFRPVVIALGMTAPDTAYSVRLVSLNGKTNVRLGTVGFGAALERARLEAAMDRLMGKKTKKTVRRISKVAKPKFKRTVVFYDGDSLRHEIGGVIKVPRNSYQHFPKREELMREAERQEKEEQRVQAEYAAALAAEKAEWDRLDREAEAEWRRGLDEAAVDAALSQCRLIVESNRSKGQKKPRNTERR